MISLHSTEGLWECDKTIRGHRVACCTSFMSSTPPPPKLFLFLIGKEWESPAISLCKSTPQVWPSRCASQFSWTLPLGSSSHSHYFEYIIVLAALSSPSPFFFPFFLLLFWIEASWGESLKTIEVLTLLNIQIHLLLRFSICSQVPVHVSLGFEKRSLLSKISPFTQNSKVYTTPSPFRYTKL